jgi:hypothetical protein
MRIAVFISLRVAIERNVTRNKVACLFLRPSNDPEFDRC